MLEFSLKVISEAINSPVVIPAAIVASFNMLVNIAFSVCFGERGICKIRGYRGD